MTTAIAQTIGEVAWKSQVGIPVRNLWLLLVYAFDLADFHERFDSLADEAADLPELLARLLCVVVERRLRKNLTRAYLAKAEVLSRVKGRIDWLQTETGMLIQRGEVACRFEDLTYDTPRNRLARTALVTMAGRVSDRNLARDCRVLGRQLEAHGVGLGRPSHNEMTKERVSRHDAEDRLLMTVARIALDLVLPGEIGGATSATRLEREEKLLRRIFEKSVAGICKAELHGRSGRRVQAQKLLLWAASNETEGFRSWLPQMSADVVIERGQPDGSIHRVIIETKFANALTLNAYEADRFKSGHLYQLYSYLRTQSSDLTGVRSEGVLVYPVVDREIDEWATIQGHKLRVATVDLRVATLALKQRIVDMALGKMAA